MENLPYLLNQQTIVLIYVSHNGKKNTWYYAMLYIFQDAISDTF